MQSDGHYMNVSCKSGRSTSLHIAIAHYAGQDWEVERPSQKKMVRVCAPCCSGKTWVPEHRICMKQGGPHSSVHGADWTQPQR